jgi:putative mRNA 3-end processing factor
VELAVITHAHADHLKPGSRSYLVSEPGRQIAAERLPEGPVPRAIAYREPLKLGDVTVSLHPAGHLLGSSQVRIETADSVWVATGDYKRASDPSCLPFELVACDVLVSEATFALPAYQWPETAEVIEEILTWWQDNAAQGVASVLFAYALGKAQRVLAELAPLTDQTIYLHGAVSRMTDIYRAAGVRLAATAAVPDEPAAYFKKALIIAPPSAAGSPWLRRFGDASHGMCSGWMRIRGDRRRRGVDRGFVLSDHADWPGLLATVRECGAKRVLLTHGHGEAFARYLRELGLDASAMSAPYGAEA